MKWSKPHLNEPVICRKYCNFWHFRNLFPEICSRRPCFGGWSIKYDPLSNKGRYWFIRKLFKRRQFSACKSLNGKPNITFLYITWIPEKNVLYSLILNVTAKVWLTHLQKIYTNCQKRTNLANYRTSCNHYFHQKITFSKRIITVC